MYKIPANTLFVGQRLIYVPECHSTNSLLLELNDHSELPEGTVVVTDRQTAGRGQRGNTWEAEPGSNLTCSVLLRPGFLRAHHQFELNMAVSLAVTRTLKGHISQAVRLKWPNDIFISDKKVGGILIENQLSGDSISASVIGTGLNINQDKFGHPAAASLLNFSGKTSDLNEIFQELMECLEQEYLELRTRDTARLKKRYLDALYRKGERHKFHADGKDFMGTIDDVDPSGRLCISTEAGIRQYSFQEVKFVI